MSKRGTQVIGRFTIDRLAKLPPLRKSERDAFNDSFYTRLRQDAERATFKFKGYGDAANPKHAAKRIRAAVEGDTPTQIYNDIESGIHLMALAAGNSISLEAPLEVQYMAAMQRNADWHGEQLLHTPEEFLRNAALCRANIIVLNALDAFDAWKKAS